MQNSTFDPQNIYDYQKAKLNKDAKGVSGTATAGQTTNLDLTLTDDSLITGGNLICVGQAQGDYCHLQVVYGGTVISQYVTDWFIDPNNSVQKTPIVYYPAKLPTGFTLRLVYVSTGQNNVWIALNYDKEKVIV